tara:strand:- start:3218 stop:3601 length:384 start_codon:yes stop_codon:yes gene_type:complete
MNIQNNFHILKNIIYKNLSIMKNHKNVKWKDNIDKYCLAEKGLLSELDSSNRLLEDNKLEKMDLMEKGLINNFIYEDCISNLSTTKNQKFYDNINKTNNKTNNNIKNYDAYGTENFIEEKMYFNNDL